MAGLVHDRPLTDTGRRCRRREASAQAMAGELGGVEADCRSCPLDDERHGFVGEPLGLELPVTVDRPEERPLRDPRYLKPGAEPAHRAGSGLEPYGTPIFRPLPS